MMPASKLRARELSRKLAGLVIGRHEFRFYSAVLLHFASRQRAEYTSYFYEPLDLFHYIRWMHIVQYYHLYDF